MRTLLVLSTLLAACGGGTTTIPCQGVCGSFVVTVTLVDTSGGTTTCNAAGVDKFEFTYAGDGGAPQTQLYPCSTDSFKVGLLPVASYNVVLRALDKTGAGMGRTGATDSISTQDQLEPMNLRLVPGAPSQLGTSCEAGCADGYTCVHVSLSAGGDLSFCTRDCGVGPAMSTPENGELACQAGFSTGGKPSCVLYGSGSGDVSHSCGVLCKVDADCPAGTTCSSGLGSQPLCGVVK
jgi:hypothetical protein